MTDITRLPYTFSSDQFTTKNKDCPVYRGELVSTNDPNLQMELEEGYMLKFPAVGATYNFTLRAFARGEKTMLYEFVEFKVSDCSTNTITDPNGVWPA